MIAPIILPVILAGGVGMRLWPVSRTSLPKQFCPIFGSQSLFQQTVERVSHQAFHRPIIITDNQYRFIVSDQLAAINAHADIYLEPCGRNTAPAVIAAAFITEKKYENTVVAVFPADHHVGDKQDFIDTLISGVEHAEAGKLVTFGVEPTKAETGFGYIEINKRGHDGVLEVVTFHEKPDPVIANKYFKSGRHLWNSGIFLFRPSTIIELAEKFEAETAKLVGSAVDSAELRFGYSMFAEQLWLSVKSQSVDYAICERASNIACVPIRCHWNDLGDWKSLMEAEEQDADGNVLSNNTTTIDCKNTLLFSSADGIHLAAVGVDNIVAVVTDDAVLVANKDRSQEVKNVVEVMKTNNVTQSSQHKKDYRPWGNFISLALGTNYQVKQLEVKPGGKLSLQSHQFRSEHWVVVKGRATVFIDAKNPFSMKLSQHTSSQVKSML